MSALTCLGCESVRDQEETAPLLRPPSSVNYFYIFLLLLILLVGVGVGSYLLFEEREWDEGDHKFPLVIEIQLGDDGNQKPIAAMELPVRKVQLREFIGPLCVGRDACLRLVKRLTEANQTKYCNFFVDANATLYQGLGWNNRCEICDSSTLIVTVLSFNNNDTSVNQTQGLRKLLNYGAFTEKLDKCYEMSVLNPNTKLLDIANNVTSSNQKNTCHIED